jgi:hypothetical protein
MNSKKEIVFTSISKGSKAMDELKENNYVDYFLTKVGRWMNLRKIE